MLLVHQVGSVRVGEVVRYTLTYTPALDRILPCPTHLHVRIRNTSAIPLRAAYIVGPYALYTACYPSDFDPSTRSDSVTKDDAPQFEPNLKAGGTWTTRLAVPERVRESAGKAGGGLKTDNPSVTWIIDISSQIIFSSTAAVSFDLLVGRDERSVDLGFVGLGSKAGASPGRVEDHLKRANRPTGTLGSSLPKGVFSPAVSLVVEDTDSLWNKPPYPTWEGETAVTAKQTSLRRQPTNSSFNMKSPRSSGDNATGRKAKQENRAQKRIHLVVLTHGLHGNMGADLLYLKERIDSTAKQAKESRRRQRDTMSRSDPLSTPDLVNTTNSGVPANNGATKGELAESEDEEEVLVRGFPGNACRTERGVQYLGKRVAKWVLATTYPDQDYLPQKKNMKKKLSKVFTSDDGTKSGSNIPQGQSKSARSRAYKITSISFIAHSLGGLTQTYAIAYIHKHSPHFFEKIRPINFVTMATPFLGLSNENPLYVRFALDLGLVGRTGQDLGLSWRTPTVVRSGWEAMIGGMGSESQRGQKQPDPGSKPLLRILPTGHTHEVMKLFRNRTVYSNVVNDGIVPPRTSCLLFLDWSGLGRVEKARRENGLIGTTLGWGWAELTGANSTSRTHLRAASRDGEFGSSDMSDNDGLGLPKDSESRAEVPQPSEDAVADDAAQARTAMRAQSVDEGPKASQRFSGEISQRRSSVENQTTSPISGLFSLFRLAPHKPSKQSRIYQRSQTTKADPEGNVSPSTNTPAISRNTSPNRPGVVRGDSLLGDSDHALAPPKTSIFESAGDVLDPPLPSAEFITNPGTRPQTIFHDRVYHPEDIPPPRAKRPRRSSRTLSDGSHQGTSSSQEPNKAEERQNTAEHVDMKVEEKIARAYHHGLSWRKVLVRLEPDAHNNIVVRRMFANAYGWPVVQHMVDTHFGDTWEANTADAAESNQDHADNVRIDEPEEDRIVDDLQAIKRTASEMREASDDVGDLQASRAASGKSESKRSSYSSRHATLSRADSAHWDDALFDVTDESEEGEEESGSSQHQTPPHHQRPILSVSKGSETSTKGTSEAEIAEFLTRSPLPADDEDDPSLMKGDYKTRAAGSTTTSVGLTRSIGEQLVLGSPAKPKEGK